MSLPAHTRDPENNALRQNNDTTPQKLDAPLRQVSVNMHRADNREQLPLHIELPPRTRPVAIIGAGTVVEDGHLPAYRQLGLDIAGITDRDYGRAREVAERFAIGHDRVFASTHELLRAAPENAVIDIATPPAAFTGMLRDIPDGRAVLIQKPMGENLETARTIAALCKHKALQAAVNFQLRYAPAVLGANALIAGGRIGTPRRIEVQVNYPPPDEWGTQEAGGYDTSRYRWEFTRTHPHPHLYYSFVHLLDLLRAFLGDPRTIASSPETVPDKLLSLHCRQLRLTFDAGKEATVGWALGDTPGHFFTIIGQRGRIRLSFPVSYPNTGPDTLEHRPGNCSLEKAESIPVEGAWFPEAFRGTMAALQCRCEDPAYLLPTRVDESLRTMIALDAVVRALDKETVPIVY